MERLKYVSRGASWKIWLPVYLAVLCILGCQSSPEIPFLQGAALKGFDKIGTTVVYDKNNIFDYINGEAEVYLTSGFELLYTQVYRKRDSRVLLSADVYDMGRSKNAKMIFGRYSDQENSIFKLQGLGDLAWTDNYIVLFCRACYFFRVWPSVTFQSITRPKLEDMLELSRALDKRLKSYMRLKES
jgi:hypothetical protein